MLDRDASIPLTEFAGLVARYVFQRAEWVLCQLDEKGSVCRQEHGRGWIARRRDGKEGFIGRNCAHDHFGADANFSSEARRIDRELRVDDLVDRIRSRQSSEGSKAEPAMARPPVGAPMATSRRATAPPVSAKFIRSRLRSCAVYSSGLPMGSPRAGSPASSTGSAYLPPAHHGTAQASA